jgi:hypothetical protein
MRVRRPHPATVVALFAVAGASQIVAGFDGRPTPLQLSMTVLHALVAGGAAGWMAMPERRVGGRMGSGAPVLLEKNRPTRHGWPVHGLSSPIDPVGVARSPVAESAAK